MHETVLCERTRIHARSFSSPSCAQCRRRSPVRAASVPTAPRTLRPRARRPRAAQAPTRRSALDDTAVRPPRVRPPAVRTGSPCHHLVPGPMLRAWQLQRGRSRRRPPRAALRRAERWRRSHSPLRRSPPPRRPRACTRRARGSAGSVPPLRSGCGSPRTTRAAETSPSSAASRARNEPKLKRRVRSGRSLPPLATELPDWSGAGGWAPGEGKVWARRGWLLAGVCRKGWCYPSQRAAALRLKGPS